MSFVKIWVHAVWGTKNKYGYFNTEKKHQLIEFIKHYAREKSIFIDSINGSKEHLHCLISLSNEQNIANTIKLIKGASSNWINKTQLIKTKFQWAEDYFAVSVSESMVDKVRNYIKNQEEHHKTKSFDEEYKEFMSKYGFL